MERLNLTDSNYSVAFQSRLGREPWLTPATDEKVRELAANGVKRLAILSPAFVADCIETLEELGMQAKDDFMSKGGEEFKLISSLNSEDIWVRNFAKLLKRSLPL